MTDYSHIPAPPPPPVAAPPALELAPEAPAASPARSHRGLLAGMGVLVVLAVLGVAVLATRGGDGGPSNAFARAAAATEAQKTARVEMSMTLPFGEVQEPVTVTGEIDFTKRLSHFTMDLAALAGASGSPAGDLRGLEMITAGTAVYMKMPGLETLTGGSGKWIKIDYAKVMETSGLDPDEVLSRQNNDPTKVLDLLRQQAGDITEVGTEDVRGVSTTHYRATIDTRAVLEGSGQVKDQARFDEAMAQITGPMTVDVWIDADGLVRRQTLATPMASGTLSYRYEFFDFGTPVTVAVPSDADAIDMSKMLGGK